MMGVDGERRRKHMFYLVKLFRCKLLQALRCDDKSVDNVVSSFLLPSPSPIQAVLCPGNEQCIELATYLRENGSFDIYAIRSPTVPKGSERLRIIIHYHNTEEEVVSLVQLLSSKLMQIINIPRSKL
jgi:8-amino-7-oxononanoate synthase